MKDLMKASREKWWSEIDSEEKTARLRHRVKELENDLRELRQKLGGLLKHTHGEKGLLVPMDTYTGQSERAYSRGKTNDDIYF